MFTTVASYSDPIEAQLALGLLHAEGIPGRLDDIGTAIANWEWRLAIGGIRLRVPDAQAVHARRVLAALDAGEYALDEHALDEDALDENRLPVDKAASASAGPAGPADRVGAASAAGALRAPNRESVSSRFAWAALMLFGLPLPWRRRRDDDDSASVREV